MSPARLVSYTPDHEGVVLARLSASGHSRYVEVGTDPERSAGRTLADVGWSGVIVHEGAGAPERSGALVVSSVDAIPSARRVDVLLAGTTACAEQALSRVRAEVAVCPSEMLAPDYREVLRLGRTGLFVHDDADAEVAALLSAAPSALDNWEPVELVDVRRDRDELAAVAMRWRSLALSKWPGESSPVDEPLRAELEALRRQLEAVYGTLSWRVTAPLRMVRRRLPRSVR